MKTGEPADEGGAREVTPRMAEVRVGESTRRDAKGGIDRDSLRAAVKESEHKIEMLKAQRAEFEIRLLDINRRLRDRLGARELAAAMKERDENVVKIRWFDHELSREKKKCAAIGDDLRELNLGSRDSITERVRDFALALKHLRREVQELKEAVLARLPDPERRP
jgi:predicted  nucleic acid-binding Zn-ribbon protein